MAKKGISAITGLPKAMVRYIFESRDELKKVSWPSRDTTVRFTIVVVVASIGLGIVTGGIDWVLAQILERVI